MQFLSGFLLSDFAFEIYQSWSIFILPPFFCFSVTKDELALFKINKPISKLCCDLTFTCNTEVWAKQIEKGKIIPLAWTLSVKVCNTLLRDGGMHMGEWFVCKEQFIALVSNEPFKEELFHLPRNIPSVVRREWWLWGLGFESETLEFRGWALSQKRWNSVFLSLKSLAGFKRWRNLGTPTKIVVISVSCCGCYWTRPLRFSCCRFWLPSKSNQ